jgi:hypothetical protein
LLADYRNENSSLFLLQRLGEVLIKSISLMSFDLVQESARQALKKQLKYTFKNNAICHHKGA